MSVKISELPILDSLADNDILAGVDVSGNVTSKIEMSTLKNYIDTNTQYTAGTNIDITNNVISAPDVPTKEEFDSLSTIFNAFPTESDEDESMTLDGTAEVKFKKFDLKGNTSQITYTGKNLLNLNLSKSVNQNGITYSVANDGTITINGTATANVDIQYLNEALQTLANTKYCLNYIYVSGSLNGTIHIFNQDSSHGWNGWNMNLYASNSGHNVVTLTSFTTDMNMSGAKVIRVDNGAVLNNLKFKIQFTKSESADYDYEPYTGGTASPNPSYPQPVNVVSGDNEINVVGKNLLNYVDKLKTNYSGLTSVINKDGSITTTGIPNGDYCCIVEYNINNSLENGETYTLWQETPQAHILYMQVNAISKSGGATKYYSLNTGDAFKTFVADTDNYNYIMNIQTEGTNSWGSSSKTITNKYMLELGTTPTDFEPYQGNTYNIDLPVENLFNKNGNLMLDYRLANDGGNFRDIGYYISEYIPINANTTYTKNSPTADYAHRVCFFSNNDTTNFISKSEDNTFTTPSNAKYLRFCGLQTELNTTQLEKGSKANNFTPYGTTPIELCKIGTYQDYFYKGEGYNLLPNNATTQTINGVTFKVNDDKSVTLNGTASAIADFYMFGGSTDTGEYLYIPKGTYSISTPGSGWFYIGREKTLGAVVGNSALLNALSSQDCYFYGFIIRATSGSSFSNLTLFPMINEGTTALPYEPYGSKGKWLLHKEIGKVVFTGGNDETWNTSETSTSGINRFVNLSIKDYVVKPSAESVTLSMYCNYFVSKSANQTYTRQEGIDVSKAGNFHVYADSTKSYTVAQFKTWLSTHILSVYYPLATPTNTEITYEPLIEQLNELEKAMSKDGQTNISQVSNDKPFILDVTAIKSLQNVLDRIELLES